VIRSARRCQLRAKRRIRRRRRNPTSASSTVTRAPGGPCGREVPPRRETETTRLGRSHRSSPRSASMVLVPFETVRDKRRTSRWSRRRGGVATTSTDQHALPGDPGEPSTTRLRLGRAETHLRRTRATTAGRRRVAEPTETSKPQTGHDRKPAPTYARPRRCCHHRVRLTCAKQHSEMFEPPDVPRRPDRSDHRRCSESVYPEGRTFPETASSDLSLRPRDVSCPDRTDVPGRALRETRSAFSTLGVLRATSDGTSTREPHECGAPDRAGFGLLALG